MSETGAKSNTLKRILLIVLSIVLLAASTGVYWTFANETNIDSKISEKYLADNGIEKKDFYGTAQFKEINEAIQAKRNSYWHRMYIIPVILSFLALAVAAVQLLLGGKGQKKLISFVDSSLPAVSGLFFFIVSLVRLLTADFGKLYLTSESSAWKGLGVVAIVLTVLCIIVLFADIFFADKSGAYMPVKKAAGDAQFDAEDDSDNIFYPVASESDDEDNNDSEDEN